MREEIAALVLPVFRAGIDIKEGLRLWPRDFQFSESRTKLLGLLQEPVRHELRGEVMGDVLSPEMLGSTAINARVDIFLGIRYALACWLDDIFILDSVWRDAWNENKMETTLFGGMNICAEKFWQQAQLAKTRTTRDALEVYYLCVMLGFRGELHGKPVELQKWRETVQAQIIGGEGRAYTPPPGLKIPPNVPILTGNQIMERWLFLVTAIGLAFIPVIAWLITRG